MKKDQTSSIAQEWEPTRDSGEVSRWISTPLCSLHAKQQNAKHYYLLNNRLVNSNH